MAFQPSTQYLKTQVMTASPEMLQLMLWDGAIRFAEQGKDAILRKDIEGSYKSLLRAQKIIMEMTAALRPKLDPDLCTKLAALYNFIYRRLVDANLHKTTAPVEDALKVMRHQRETWAMLIEKISKQRAADAIATVDENAEAIAASAEIPDSPPLPVAPEPAQAANSVTASMPPSPLSRGRSKYPGVTLKPAPTPTTHLSVEG